MFFFVFVLSSSSSYVVSSSFSSCAHVFEAKSRQDEKKTKSPTQWQDFLLELCMDPLGSDYVADKSLKPHNKPASFEKFLIEGSVCWKGQAAWCRSCTHIYIILYLEIPTLTFPEQKNRALHHRNPPWLQEWSVLHCGKEKCSARYQVRQRNPLLTTPPPSPHSRRP